MRGIVAAGLAVFLVATASWASACDLSCSLQRMAGDCDRAAANSSPAAGAHCEHPARDNSSKIEMAGMPDMPGMPGMAAAGGVTAASPAADGSQPCSRNSVSASAAVETGRYELKTAFAAVAVVAAAGEQVLPAKLSASRGLESPPPRSAAVNPLSIHLRV